MPDPIRHPDQDLRNSVGSQRKRRTHTGPSDSAEEDISGPDERGDGNRKQPSRELPDIAFCKSDKLYYLCRIETERFGDGRSRNGTGRSPLRETPNRLAK